MHRSADEALEELERWSGTQFDPACVDALRRVVAVEHRLAA
jgi:HD-GYP domain-containing protein (c-di-GMP phosphodiesterase class II)